MKSIAFLFPFLALAAGCVSSPEKAEQTPVLYPEPVFDTHIYLPVTINDSIRGEFIFDTGASDLYIDSLFQARWSVESLPVGRGRVTGVGKGAQNVRILIRPLDFTLPSGHYTTTSVTPLIHLKEILGKRADGIVGLNFFIGKYLRIDYLNGDFQVSDTLPDTTGYRCIPLLKQNDRLLADARVSIAGKTIEGTFLIDTGSGQTIYLTNATAQEYDLPGAPIERTAYRNSHGGIGGETEYAACVAQHIILDTFTLNQAGISYSLDNNGTLGEGRPFLGIIGNRLLNRFDVIFDLKDMRLLLRPNASYDRPYDNYSHDILLVDRTDICQGLVVNGMAIDGSAEKSGLKTGDILTAIDTVPARILTSGKIKQMLTDSSRTVLTLSVERSGQSLHLDYRTGHTL